MNYDQTVKFLYSQLPAYHRVGRAALRMTFKIHKLLMIILDGRIWDTGQYMLPGPMARVLFLT